MSADRLRRALQRWLLPPTVRQLLRVLAELHDDDTLAAGYGWDTDPDTELPLEAALQRWLQAGRPGLERPHAR